MVLQKRGHPCWAWVKGRWLGTPFGNREWSEWIWEFKVPGNPSRKEREEEQCGEGRALASHRTSQVAFGLPWEACPEQSPVDAAGRPKQFF